MDKRIGPIIEDYTCGFSPHPASDIICGAKATVHMMFYELDDDGFYAGGMSCELHKDDIPDDLVKRKHDIGYFCTLPGSEWDFELNECTIPTNNWPRPKGCDAEHPSIYMNSDGEYICRCLICARCKRHTGNATQGHFWKLCKVMYQQHDTHKAKSSLDCKECLPDFHFCCPDNCELYLEDGTVRSERN